MVVIIVIEVGVNVFNVSVMVIENIECFGFFQLYQFRGCVGWGVDQLYCIFMLGFKFSNEGKEWIVIMVCIMNGFEIVEVDLCLCGFGNIEGIQ